MGLKFENSQDSTDGRRDCAGTLRNQCVFFTRRLCRTAHPVPLPKGLQAPLLFVAGPVERRQLSGRFGRLHALAHNRGKGGPPAWQNVPPGNNATGHRGFVKAREAVHIVHISEMSPGRKAHPTQGLFSPCYTSVTGPNPFQERSEPVTDSPHHGLVIHNVVLSGGTFLAPEDERPLSGSDTIDERGASNVYEGKQWRRDSNR